jgi:hypothetical protein
MTTRRQQEIEDTLRKYVEPIEGMVQRLRDIWKNEESQVFHHVYNNVVGEVRWNTSNERLAQSCGLAAVAEAARLPRYDGEPLPTPEEEDAKLGILRP